jgi:hypothetical protein
VQALLEMDQAQFVGLFPKAPDAAYGTMFQTQLDKLRRVRPVNALP